MAMVTQFGGRTYDTNNYPYVLLNRTRDNVEARFSTIEKAHQGRLMTSLNNPDDIILLFNEKTGIFIEWRKKELQLFEKYKYDSSGYFDRVLKKYER
jgi:hypothetical protein